MFGATPRCPRCDKAVYAAEQILGPGRKFYHKYCLKCTSCSRRLDSYTLLEHDEQPYCKACHLKNFATTNLRHANLPNAPRRDSAEDASSSSPPASPARVSPINVSEANNLPRLRPNRVLSPTSTTFSRPGSRPGSSSGAVPTLGSTRRHSLSFSPPITPPEESVADGEGDTSVDSSREDESVISTSTDPTSVGDEEESEVSSAKIPTNTGRPGLGNIPRTIPLTFDHSSHVRPSRHKSTKSLGSIREAAAPNSEPSSSYLPSHSPLSPGSRATPAAAALNLLQKEGIDYPAPLRATPTGSRYGAALSGGGIAPQATGSRYTSPLSGGGIAPQVTGTRYGAALNAGISPQQTGTRYGVALSGGIGMQTTGSARKWGGSTPQCPKCEKSVYFAEQVKAVGKTYHKHCLRCTECGTTLDSTKLRDHDEEPFCVRCYNKLYGPQGNGYALLGKAGG